jgi:hypothetical protein
MAAVSRVLSALALIVLSWLLLLGCVSVWQVLPGGDWL